MAMKWFEIQTSENKLFISFPKHARYARIFGRWGQFTLHLKRALKSVAIWKPTCVQTKWQKWWLKMVIKAALCYDYDCYCSTSSSLLYLLVFRWTVFSTFADPFWEWTEMFVSKEGSNCIVFISRAAFQGLNPNSDRLTLKIVKRELTL